MSEDRSRVIIIDDDHFILASMMRGLRNLKQIEFIYFDDARLALEATNEKPADMYICDHQMPGMDGLEFMQRVHVLSPGSRKLMLSGGKVEEADVAQAGIDRFLMKPIENSILQHVILELLA